MSKPVYAVVGDDTFLQLKALAGIFADLPKDAERIDVDGERAELSDVLDDLRSFAMFGPTKVVVVRDADDFVTRFRAQLEDYVAAPSDSGTLVLRLSSLPAAQRIHKAIQKVGQIIPCTPPKERELPRWIMERAKAAHRLTLDLPAANLLADLIGADLGRLDNEIAKLALQSDDGRVGTNDINGTVAFQREQEMWHLTDALTQGRTDEAVRRWRHLVHLDSSSEYRAVTWLIMWLEKMVKARALKKEGLSPFAIAKEAKIWPPGNIDAILRAADAVGDAELFRAVNLLADVDKRSKSGVGDAAENVERFMLMLAAK